jgi:hypothetical protein
LSRGWARRVTAIAAVLVAACSTTTGDATPTPSHAVFFLATPTTETGDGATPATSLQPPAATAIPAPGSVFTFKGSGTRKSKAFSFAAPAKVEYSFSGSGNFIVDLDTAEGSDYLATIANLIGSYKATTWIYGDGTPVRAYLDVIANGSYTIKVSSNAQPPVASLPHKFTGRWNLATSAFSASGDVTIAFSHKGSGNFIVELIDASDGSYIDTLVNEIGITSGQTYEYGVDGTYALDVTADGAWSVSISL